MCVSNYRSRLGWILCLLTVTMLCDGLSERAFSGNKISEYTADQVRIDPMGKVQYAGKVYVTPDKIRIDGLALYGAGTPALVFRATHVLILRRDKGMAWTLNPDKKLYMERLLNEKQMDQAINRRLGSKNEKILGTEKVNGFECTQKEFETTVSFMDFKRTVKTTVWMSDRLDMPIRAKSSDGWVTELREIKEGAPASEYFKIPQGYKKVANMMALMGMNMSEHEEKPSKTAGEAQ